MLILASLVGLISGIAAVTLKETVHFIQEILLHLLDLSSFSWLYIVYPFFGILITVFVANVILKDKLGHGITDILYSISKKSGIIRQVKMYSRMITSAITVGFGGSVGLEAPIVVTGSAIGSNIGRFSRLTYQNRTLLIGCGSAGAISAIFNSPIAGVIFAIEVILTEVTISAFIPILISSVSGAIISLTLLGDDVLFSFRLQDQFQAADTPFYILLGVLGGLASLYFTRVNYWVDSRFRNIDNRVNRALLGGILIGGVIFIFPPIYGEGYDSIKAMISGNPEGLFRNSILLNFQDNHWFLMAFLFGVILVKPFASSITIAAGGSGGVFAPSLFLGGFVGFLFATVLNLPFFGLEVSTSNFTLVGMCSVMSGVLHAPLTAIFLIAEITGGYELFVPLMLVSAISYSTISYFEKYSIYTKSLVERGDFIPDDRDRRVLSLINLEKIIEKDLLVISPEKSLDDLVRLVMSSRRNIFPVVNAHDELEGIITLDDIREIMFDEESRKKIKVRELMHRPPTFVELRDSMNTVMNKFEITNAWNLPVIDEGKYVGFLSKSRIFNAYRTKLRRKNSDY